AAAGDAAARVPAVTMLSAAARGADCGESAPVAAGALPEDWRGFAWTGCAGGGSLALALHPEAGLTTAAQLALLLDWFEAIETGDAGFTMASTAPE
ncbi:MAG: hypothetical protein ACFBWO_05315, partial [Paracoccaceae bacterium]